MIHRTRIIVQLFFTIALLHVISHVPLAADAQSGPRLPAGDIGANRGSRGSGYINDREGLSDCGHFEPGAPRTGSAADFDTGCFH